jgi:hypothetical protein
LKIIRHSRAGGNPEGLFNMLLAFVLATQGKQFIDWIPAFAGMTKFDIFELA